ncbi:MAG: hypothetical protein LQ343_006630 [Gyalolechia ehrenbergii]|nr:MAG: hypothetical protein LQ343_006630 [Gyalolechia ehrenbergii]
MIQYSVALFSYRCFLSVSFLVFARAADYPPANNVTWLYPSDYTQIFTFNTLDIVNVSWISAYAPTFLDLACHSASGGFSSVLNIQAPATGNRLISLNPAATYQRCRFEISAPENFSKVSHSPSFNMDVHEDWDPVIWNAQQIGYRVDESCASSSSQHKTAMHNKQTMIGIGVGVAVGVFAITTLVYTLVIIAIRKRQAQQEAKRPIGKRSMTKEWVIKSSLSSRDFCHKEGAEGGGNQSSEEWMEKQTRNGDLYEMRRRSRAES